MSHNHPYRRAFTLGMGFLGVSAIWPVFNTYVPLLLADLGLGVALIGFVMTWDNYFNIFLQPAVGQWSDRTGSRWGQRKPWLLVGAPLAALGFVVIPLVNVIWGIMVAILLTNVGMALFRSPLVALLGDLFPTKQRSQANGVINVMGGLGAITALVGGGLLYRLGAASPFLFAAALMVAAVLLVLVWVHEPSLTQCSNQNNKPPDASFNPYRPYQPYRFLPRFSKPMLLFLLVIFCVALAIETVQAWVSSFGVFSLEIERGWMATMLGVSFVLPSLLFAFPSGLIGGRFGRPHTLLSGCLLMLLAMGSGWFVNSEETLIAVLAIGGIASALITVNALPLLFDLDGNHHRFGLLTGCYYLANNLAAVVGPQGTGLLIDLTGQNYRVMFLVGLVCMVLAVGLILWLVNYQD